MKIKKRFIFLAILIVLAVIFKIDLILIGSVVILGVTFYGFYLIAKQSRLDDRKSKLTKNDPLIQSLLKAERQADLINWQFQSIPTMSENTNKGEIGMFVLFAVGFVSMLSILLTNGNLILKMISLVTIMLLANIFYQFFKKRSQASGANLSPVVEKFELTPTYFIHTKNDVISQIDWYDIEQIKYADRAKFEPSAIEIILNTQLPIVIEQNFLAQDIHITIQVLKNYWYLCAKGKPLPKIS